MKKINKKEFILIILLVVVLLLSIGLTMLKLLFKPEEINNPNQNDEELKELVNTINDINSVFENIDLNNSTKYTKNENIICYKYNGNDTEKYIEKIYNLYSYPYLKDKGFDVVLTTTKEGNIKRDLYVCKEEKCNVSKITSYQQDTVEENGKVIVLNNISYMMFKGQEKWMFIEPVIICEG